MVVGQLLITPTVEIQQLDRLEEMVEIKISCGKTGKNTDRQTYKRR